MSHHQNEVDAQLELEDKNEAVEFSLTDVIAEETNIEPSRMSIQIKDDYSNITGTADVGNTKVPFTAQLNKDCTLWSATLGEQSFVFGADKLSYELMEQEQAFDALVELQGDDDV